MIAQKVFKKDWELPYSRIVHEKGKDLDELCEAIFELYLQFISPFFEKCNNDFLFVHEMFNGYDIEKTGLGVSYENRALKGLIVAIEAGIERNALVLLANAYEEELRKDGLPFLENFLEVRKKLNLE